MAILRTLVRLVGVVWMLVLALFGLGVALYCVDALVSLGSVRPDRLLHLPSVRDHVGRFLDQMAAPGATAGLALLCGLGAMLLGVLVLIGVLGRRRDRLVILDQDRHGVIAARRRPLSDMTRALAEPVNGATSVKRPKFSLSRRGTRGTLKVNATRTRKTDARELQTALEKAVAPITEPFGLTPRVRVRLGESGNRVQ
ncbi:MAG: hypothetical protein WAL22_17840 [Solirubrobacteraceae bacterium]